MVNWSIYPLSIFKGVKMDYNNQFPSGLSWGTRGFRIGKSIRGNWWVSIGLPFGFRYTWRIPSRNQSTPIDTQKNLKLYGKQNQSESNQINKPVKTRNQDIIKNMK